MHCQRHPGIPVTSQTRDYAFAGSLPSFKPIVGARHDPRTVILGGPYPDGVQPRTRVRMG